MERAFGGGLREHLAGRGSRQAVDVRGRAYARFAGLLDARLRHVNDELERLSRDLALAEERLDGRWRPTEPAVVQLAAEPSPPSEPAPGEHLLFVPSASGYRLLVRPGVAPEAGSELELPELGGRFLVSKLAAAPFPGDPRQCAYLLR